MSDTGMLHSDVFKIIAVNRTDVNKSALSATWDGMLHDKAHFLSN